MHLSPEFDTPTSLANSLPGLAEYLSKLPDDYSLIHLGLHFPCAHFLAREANGALRVGAYYRHAGESRRATPIKDLEQAVEREIVTVSLKYANPSEVSLELLRRQPTPALCINLPLDDVA